MENLPTFNSFKLNEKIWEGFEYFDIKDVNDFSNKDWFNDFIKLIQKYNKNGGKYIGYAVNQSDNSINIILEKLLHYYKFDLKPKYKNRNITDAFKLTRATLIFK